MVQKPPVDIEWYNDGFSIEEQNELRKQYNKQKAANRPKIKVTEEYYERTKDKIISDLRQKLAADEEYIKELEDENGITKLKRSLESTRAGYKDSYKDLKKNYDKLLDGSTVKELEEQIASLKKNRDYFLSKYLLCSQ